MDAAADVAQMVLVNRRDVEQLQAQVQELRNQLNAREAARYRARFTTYSGEEKNPITAFENFETNCRLVIQVMNYTMPAVRLAILAELRGKAAQTAKSIITEEFPDLDAFFNKLRSLFLSPSYADVSKSLFMNRVQQDDETVLQFHGALRVLFERAFPNADERVESELIRRFIGGLKTEKLHTEMRLNPPETYQDCLTSAMRIEGRLQMINLEREMQTRARKGELTTAPMHYATFGGATAGNGAAASGSSEPMDLGNISRAHSNGNRGRGGFNNRGGRGGQARGRGQPNRGRGGAQNSGTRPQQDGNTQKDDKCYYCNKPGHMARNCYSNPNRTGGRGARATTGATTSASTSSSSANNVNVNHLGAIPKVKPEIPALNPEAWEW